jgi:carbonic anhydrase
LHHRFSAILFVTVALSALLFTVAFAAFAQEDTPTPVPATWGYEEEIGPEYWGNLDAAYTACGEGLAQSPIDLTSPQSANLTPIIFNYANTVLNLVNTGEGARADYDAGSSITYNETEYQLLQFHFHTPSEHTLDGVSFPAEMHIVHRDAVGNLAVVGIMLELSDADNAAFALIFSNLPAEVGVPVVAQDSFTAADLLPAEQTYFTYSGSLTTPPCTQGVRWLVLTGTQTISEAQLEQFRAIVEMNARPTQPLNTRDLLLDNAG